MRPRLPVLIEILRPHNMLASALCVAVGARAAQSLTRDALLLAAIAAVVTGAGNTINDFFDISIDRVNKPARPLPSGRLSPRAAILLFAIATTLATTAAVVLLAPVLAAVVVGWELVLVLYASRLKRIFVAGTVVVAAVCASAFTAGALATGRPGASVVPFVIAFCFVFAREIVKGAEDVEGDRVGGAATLASRAGVVVAARTAAAMMIALAVTLPIPGLTGVFGTGYFWGMSLCVSPILLYGSWAIIRRPEQRTFRRVSGALKIAMFAGILAIAAGASG